MLRSPSGRALTMRARRARVQGRHCAQEGVAQARRQAAPRQGASPADRDAGARGGGLQAADDRLPEGGRALGCPQYHRALISVGARSAAGAPSGMPLLLCDCVWHGAGRVTSVTALFHVACIYACIMCITGRMRLMIMRPAVPRPPCLTPWSYLIQCLSYSYSAYTI